MLIFLVVGLLGILAAALAAGCAPTLSPPCQARINNCLGSCVTADSSTTQRAQYYGDSRTQCERACHDLCRR